jgi:hypothetical protein
MVAAPLSVDAPATFRVLLKVAAPETVAPATVADPVVARVD